MAEIRIDEGFNHLKIEVAEGDTVELKLAENPGSAYLWRIAAMDAGSMELVSSDFEPPPGENAIGGEGIRTFVFKKIGPSGGTVRLENSRQWSNEAARSFDFLY